MIGHFPSFITSRSFIVRRFLKIKFGHSRSKTRQPRGSPTAPYPDQSELMSGDQRFFDPIMLPGRKQPLVTLRDAAQYITKLPKAEHDTDEWQVVMEAILLAAELDGPPMFARIGAMRAINRHVERAFDRRAKTSNGGRRKVVRDQ
jgi:hypothetical protein